MPFRDRVKRALGRSNGDSSDNGKLSKFDTLEDTNVYQPGEPMPKAKYRQPVDKKHKENLEAFSFMENSRRTSYQSQYSPMGSEAPSRSISVKAEPRKNIANERSHVGQMVEIAGDSADVSNGLSGEPSRNIVSHSTNHNTAPGKHANDTDARVPDFTKKQNGAVHEHNSPLNLT